MKFKLFGKTLGCFGGVVREGDAHADCEWRVGGKLELVNPETGDKYLTRYIIARTPFFRVFLHQFHGPDPDRHVHNHPWKAVSWILTGGYLEWLDSPHSSHIEPRFHEPGDLNWLEEDEYHRIVAVKPGTWTLVFGGPYFRDWGFLVDGKHVDWREYLGVPAGTVLND